MNTIPSFQQWMDGTPITVMYEGSKTEVHYIPAANGQLPHVVLRRAGRFVRSSPYDFATAADMDAALRIAYRNAVRNAA